MRRFDRAALVGIAAGGSVIALYFEMGAVLEGPMGRPLAVAVATALCAAAAMPLGRVAATALQYWAPKRVRIAENQLKDLTDSADSPAAIGEAFCAITKTLLDLANIAVYVRKGERLVGVAGDIPAPLVDSGVPLRDIRPPRDRGTKLLLPSDLPGLARVAATGWVLLESDRDVLGAVSVGLQKSGLASRLGGLLGLGGPLAGDDKEVFLSLCRDLAQSLRAVEFFAEFDSILRVARDLEIGREVHAGFLSRQIPAFRGIQVAANSRSAREVGGDFFDVIAVEEGRVGLIIGDAAGRGVSAAMHMSMALSFFRSLIPGASSPRQVLEQINSLICCYRSSSKTYVCALYGIYDCRDKTLTMANAGMPPPVINGRPLSLKGLPLGARESVRLREEKIPLTSGDVLVLMSDGLNATRPGGTRIGWDRVFRLVGDHTALPAESLLNQLIESTQDWSQGSLADDVTVLCLKVGEGGTRLVKDSSTRRTRKLAGLSAVWSVDGEVPEHNGLKSPDKSSIEYMDTESLN